MAIALIGSHAYTFNAGSGSITTSYDLPVGGLSLLVVYVSLTSSGDDLAVSGITWDGVAMTSITGGQPVAGRWDAMFYLVNPRPGEGSPKNLVVSVTGPGADTRSGVILAAAFRGVRQLSAYVGHFTGVSLNGATSSSLGTLPEDLAIYGAGVLNTSHPIVPGQTEIASGMNSSGFQRSASLSYQIGKLQPSATWTNGGSNGLWVAARFRAAPSGGFLALLGM